MKKHDLSTVANLEIPSAFAELQKLGLFHYVVNAVHASFCFVAICKPTAYVGGDRIPLKVRHLFDLDVSVKTARPVPFASIQEVHNLLEFGEAIADKIGHGVIRTSRAKILSENGGTMFKQLGHMIQEKWPHLDIQFEEIVHG
jgi:hypothetical protein